MNIQIFGTKKCNETKKAERFFKERGIKYQFVDMKEKGIKPRTLDGINTVLHSTFKMAVRDEIIRSNPTEGVMAEIKKSDLWVKTRKSALTVPEQKELVSFMEDNHQFKGWVPVVTVLLGTGMRIGECLGLRWEDIDLENRIISVNHNLVDFQDRELKKQVRKIQTTKTRAGIRTIPMIDEVYEAFITEFELQSAIGFCENETNLKVIQSIMGHSDITTTMDIYADATQEKKQEIMANLNGKIF